MDDELLIMRVKLHITRDPMSFQVEFPFLDEIDVEITCWDARSMEMMIMAPVYDVLDGSGVMLKSL